MEFYLPVIQKVHNSMQIICELVGLARFALLCGKIIEIFVRNLNDESFYYAATDE